MAAIDYDAWAKTYDDTRGASPSVLRALLEALGPPDGRSVLDIGGGTGNFSVALAERGFPGRLCDYSPAMGRRAAAKLGKDEVAVGDAAPLPFADGPLACPMSEKGPGDGA